MALAVIELINQVTHDEEKSWLFTLLCETLRALNSSSKNSIESYLNAFRLRLASLFDMHRILKFVASV